MTDTHNQLGLSHRDWREKVYNIEVEPAPHSTTLGELPDGSLAVITEAGEFTGELFFKNVAGLHSITRNRYWPSDYAKSHEYHGPLHLRCTPVKTGDRLTVK